MVQRKLPLFVVVSFVAVVLINSSSVVAETRQIAHTANADMQRMSSYAATEFNPQASASSTWEKELVIPEFDPDLGQIQHVKVIYDVAGAYLWDTQWEGCSRVFYGCDVHYTIHSDEVLQNAGFHKSYRHGETQYGPKGNDAGGFFVDRAKTWELGRARAQSFVGEGSISFFARSHAEIYGDLTPISPFDPATLGGTYQGTLGVTVNVIYTYTPAP